MIKEKFIVIPEPHIWDRNISTRIDYVGEVKEYMEKIKDIIQFETEDGSNCSVVWMGDIFHRGFENVEEVLYWYNYFLELAGMTYKMYSVVGNHELSYYKGNPFWYLFNSIESEILKTQSDKVFTPLGSINILNIQDRIEVGEDVVISLGHYNTQAKPIEGKKNILLTHNSIIDVEIGNVLRNKYGRDPLEHFIDYSYIRTNDVFKGFDYAFIGHMHKAFGLFTVDYGEEGLGDTRLRYLASIGRTNSDEVNDLDLERVIPIISVLNGQIVVEERTLLLRGLKETIDSDKLVESKKKYDKVKDKRELEKVSFITGSPINDIKIALGKFPLLYGWMEDSLTDTVPDYLLMLEKEVYDGRNNKWS